MFALVWAVACTGNGDGDTGTTDEPIDPAEWPTEWADAEQDVLRLVNIQRNLGATCGDTPMPGGADPLEMDDTLRDVARAHSQDMAKRNFFNHTNPSGETPEDRVAATGFAGAEPWGENIAAGSPTAEAVVDGWMHSPGHCVNIMESSYGVIGIGLYFKEGTDYGYYWTQNFAGSH